MKEIIITNNPIIKDAFELRYKVEYFPGMDQVGILLKVRDLIHVGYVLVTHPMPGRLRPYETPYKTVVIKKEYLDKNNVSIRTIEDSIAMTEKSLSNNQSLKYEASVLGDLQFIDRELIGSALEFGEGR